MTRRLARGLALLMSGAAFGLSAQGQSPKRPPPQPKLPPLEVNGVPLGAKMEQLKGRLPALWCEQMAGTVDVSQHVNKTCGEPSSPAWSQCAAREREALKFWSSDPIYYEADFRGDVLGRVFVRIGQGGIDGVIRA